MVKVVRFICDMIASSAACTTWLGLGLGFGLGFGIGLG